MEYRGYVQKGVVILDEAVDLADGTQVRIEVLDDSATSHVSSSRSLAERLSAVIGKAQTLPPDASEQHDHYLYSTPKR